MNLTASKILALKLRAIKDVKFNDNTVDWSEIILGKRIVVFQLSYTHEPKRTFLTELLLNDLWDFVKQSENDKGFLLILDEIQNMRFKGECFLSHLREFRKFGIGAVMATQFIGNGFGKAESGELLEQAATKVYFKPDNANITAAAKAIDASDYAEWMKILRSLNIGECIYSGMIDGYDDLQNIVLKVKKAG